MLRPNFKILAAKFKISILSIISLSTIFYPIELWSQPETEGERYSVYEMDNSIFKQDNHWRGADGAASIDLGDGRILWLFSDTFIDIEGRGKRENSTMIRNSIAIQKGSDIEDAEITFYYRMDSKNPDDFFNIPGKTWLWTGHGAVIDSVLVIFLFEEKSSKKGLGFQAVGWHIAIIDNPEDDPLDWNIVYHEGPGRFKVLAGSSAVIIDGQNILAYAVGNYNNEQDVYLLKYSTEMLLKGELYNPYWFVNGTWVNGLQKLPANAVLFTGQTEFSVHYQRDINKYVQIQTVGFGQCALGFRIADKPQGPWSEQVSFYLPEFSDPEEFSYSANAHLELDSNGLIITYNINNFNFEKLIKNEEIYFPKVIHVDFPASHPVE